MTAAHEESLHGVPTDLGLVKAGRYLAALYIIRSWTKRDQESVEGELCGETSQLTAQNAYNDRIIMKVVLLRL